MPFRRGQAPDQPIDEIDIALVQQNLEAFEFSVLETAKMGLGKAADEPIGLLRAPVGGAIEEALASFIHRRVPLQGVAYRVRT